MVITNRTPRRSTGFREVISEEENADSFDRLRAELGRSGLSLDGNELKTTPRGWEKDHPRMDLLRLRNLALTQTLEPGAWLQTPECFETVVDTWHQLNRWNEWLHDKVGPPDRRLRPGLARKGDNAASLP